MAWTRLMVYSLIFGIAAWLAKRSYNLYNNYCIARKLGLHIIIIPLGWQDDWWLFGWQWFKWLKWIPGVDSWFEFTRFCWTQDLRHKPHHKFGDAFAIVSPGAVELMLGDPEAVVEVQTRYKDWYKDPAIFELFNIFGKNVVTSNGSEWQRHRRLINPAFQESNNSIVWSEARRQTVQMLNGWNAKDGSTLIENIQNDCVLIALHVLYAAGFGQQHDFESGFSEVPAGHTKSFADTMKFLLNNSISVLLFYKVTLPNWMLPGTIRDVKNACADFRLYINSTVASSKDLFRKQPNTHTASMVACLIKANEEAKQEHEDLTKDLKRAFLTDDEVIGNLYLLNVAGFETTANALAYSISYLATQPDIQDWVCEELDALRKTKGDVEQWSYEDVFPQLKRSLAVMYESLRLWQPITDSTRAAAAETVPLKVGDRTIIVPAGVVLSTNNYAVQSDPRWWGEDSLEWNPKRWITLDKNGNEIIAATPPGAVFVAWSVGPRACPGKKFSQVEFAAVISLLLSKYTLEPLVMKEKGMQTKHDGRKAVSDAIWCSGNAITPKLGRTKEAGIRLVKRLC